MTRLFQSPIQGSWERLYQALLVEALSPLLAGMLRLVAFYSIASPVLHAALHIDEEERRRLLAEGGQHVVDLFLHGVLAPRS